jgi:hypothetical protein
MSNDWIKQKRWKWGRDLEIYLKNGTGLKNFVFFTEDKQVDDKITAFGQILPSGQVKLTISGKELGQKRKLLAKLKNIKLPEDTVIFENNLNFSNFAEIEYTADNLYLNLLKVLSNHSSIQKEHGFEIKIPANDWPQAQEQIKTVLAKTYPSIKSKELPDGTLSQTLLAETKDWSFVANESGFQVQKEQKLFPITAKQENDQIVINFQNDNSPNELLLTEFTKNCLTKNSSSLLKVFKNSEIKFLTIININEDKLGICIE